LSSTKSNKKSGFRGVGHGRKFRWQKRSCFSFAVASR
jgi:hypothetical protein